MSRDWMDDGSSQADKAPVYTLAGLGIISDVPLSGVPIRFGNAAAQQEIVIRRAALPEALPSIAGTFPNGQYNGKEVLLNFPEVARFLVRNGHEIIIDTAPFAHDREVHTYLLGTAFGVLCHQRGILPLHSSVIKVANGYVAFVGASGSGKSTLAAALATRGYQVIADDVCFLRSDGHGSIQAWPGVRRIRLWEDAVTALGCNGPGVEREMRGRNKYLIPTDPRQEPTEPRCLRRVYELLAHDGRGVSVTQLPGAAAIEVLMQNVYRLTIAEQMGCKPAVFAACAATANKASVFRFSRQLSFASLHEGVRLLEDHFRDIC